MPIKKNLFHEGSCLVQTNPAPVCTLKTKHGIFRCQALLWGHTKYGLQLTKQFFIVLTMPICLVLKLGLSKKYGYLNMDKRYATLSNIYKSKMTNALMLVNVPDDVQWLYCKHTWILFLKMKINYFQIKTYFKCQIV